MIGKTIKEKTMKPQLLWATPTLSIEYENIHELNEAAILGLEIFPRPVHLKSNTYRHYHRAKRLENHAKWSKPRIAVNEGLARIILEKEQDIVSKGSPTSVAGVKEGLTAHWLKSLYRTKNEPKSAL